MDNPRIQRRVETLECSGVKRQFRHDVEDIDVVPSLGTGTGDHPIARYSIETDRVIVTCDDDFVLEGDEDDYRAVLYISDATLTVKQVADVVHAVSRQYPQAELRGLEHVGSDWL